VLAQIGQTALDAGNRRARILLPLQLAVDPRGNPCQQLFQVAQVPVRPRRLLVVL
jgi:hypothetical protein